MHPREIAAGYSKGWPVCPVDEKKTAARTINNKELL